MTSAHTLDEMTGNSLLSCRILSGQDFTKTVYAKSSELFALAIWMNECCDGRVFLLK